MRPEQIPLLPHVGAPSVHPGRAWAVVSVTHASFEADDHIGQLWRVPLGAPAPGEQPAESSGALDGEGSGLPGARRITRGFADTCPKVSPDGRLIAFLRRRPGHRAQLALVESGGGEPWIITSFTQGVAEFSWAPDSRRVVVSARVPDAGRYGSVQGIDADHEDPRHLTGVKLRHNGMGAGWYADRPLQLFLVEVPDPQAEPAVQPVGRAVGSAGSDGGESRGAGDGTADETIPGLAQLRRITADGADWTSPLILPDGRVLACCETPESGMISTLMCIDPDRDLPATPVPGTGEIDVDGQTHLVAIHSVATGAGPAVFVSFADLGAEGDDPVAANNQVGVIGADGLLPLTDPDISLDHVLTAAGSGVLVTDSFQGRGRVHLVTAPRAGGEKAGNDRVVLDAEMVATSATAIPGTQNFFLATVTTPQSPGELVLIGPRGVTQLTDFGRDLREAAPPVQPEEFTAEGRDGNPVHGWILTPTGPRTDPPSRHPVVLVIHGGPHSQYTGSFFDEFQALVAAGYAVVACNPRGSAGYGRDHARAVIGHFGDVDAADVLGFLKAALATHPDLDGDRLGIMGGSYGGYLTAWIIGHDHRWRGAIVERGYLDPVSFVGASDIGWYFPDVYNGTDPGRLAAQSAMAWAEQVTTPTLVIHSEQDLRCPISQGLEYHARLVRAGVDAELLVFPGENHELSRSGTPWHRRQRMESILDFWDRHLG